MVVRETPINDTTIIVFAMKTYIGDSNMAIAKMPMLKMASFNKKKSTLDLEPVP